jgi:transcriptional regulator with XRE-family HTH domain
VKNKNETFVFDAVLFAQVLTDRRLQLGLTTRQLAKRANISQPYVVALERSRNGIDVKKTSAMSPSPTVDMITRLATALQMSANELFSLAVRPAGKHVLLLLEDDMMTSLDRARNASTKSATLTDETPQEWLCAALRSICIVIPTMRINRKQLPRHSVMSCLDISQIFREAISELSLTKHRRR